MKNTETVSKNKCNVDVTSHVCSCFSWLAVSVSVGGVSSDSAVVSLCSASEEQTPQTEAPPPLLPPSKSASMTRPASDPWSHHFHLPLSPHTSIWTGLLTDQTAIFLLSAVLTSWVHCFFLWLCPSSSHFTVIEESKALTTYIIAHHKGAYLKTECVSSLKTHITSQVSTQPSNWIPLNNWIADR